MEKVALPVLLAAMDEVDKQRLATAPANSLTTPLAQALTRIYAEQGIAVDQGLIRHVALRHTGEGAETFVDIFSTKTWEKIAPEVAASVLLEETDQYNNARYIRIDPILRDIFGTGRHRTLDSSEGRQAGMASGKGVNLVTWKPLTEGFSDISAYFSILEDVKTTTHESYVLALMLWQMMQNGWKTSYPKPLTAARHVPMFGAHLRGVDEKAEAFAMALLLPESLVLRQVKKTTGQLWWKRVRTTEETADALHVPASMLALRLKQLGLTPATTA